MPAAATISGDGNTIRGNRGGNNTIRGDRGSGNNMQAAAAAATTRGNSTQSEATVATAIT
jgi:hypothetical protein